MADYGLRLMSGAGARDLLDPASQRSAIEELTRFRHRRAEAAAEAAVAASRHARAFGDGAAAAAAALGMPASAGAAGAHGSGGGGRHRGSAAHSGGAGPAEGDPWFSLRPSQPIRQQAGLAMPGGRMVRETIGRSDPAGRR